MPKIMVVDLYGDGDVLRVVVDTPSTRAAIKEWDDKEAPMDFTSWVKEKGIVELNAEIMRLRPV